MLQEVNGKSTGSVRLKNSDRMEPLYLLQHTQCKTFVHTGANCVRLVKIGGKTKEIIMSDQGPISVTLTPADIPGALLNEPLEAHAVSALKWWLLCRGVKSMATYDRSGA